MYRILGLEDIMMELILNVIFFHLDFLWTQIDCSPFIM